MSTSTACPACHRAMVVQRPQFCPFCGYAFPASGALPTQSSAGPEQPGLMRASVPAPPSATPRASVTPSSLIRHITSSGRAIGVTVGIAALVLAAAYILWQNLTSPNPALDAALFNLVLSSHIGGGANDAVVDSYTPLMFLLLCAAPMVAVVSYWFALRRLYQERAARLWWALFGLSFSEFLVALTALGMIVASRRADADALVGGPLWVWAILGYYPALIIILALLAAICAGIGLGFANYFARWPLERIKTLHSNAWLDLALVACSGLFGIVLQFSLLGGGNFSETNMQGYWATPIAALALAAFACWSALRPPQGAVAAQPKVNRRNF